MDAGKTRHMEIACTGAIRHTLGRCITGRELHRCACLGLRSWHEFPPCVHHFHGDQRFVYPLTIYPFLPCTNSSSLEALHSEHDPVVWKEFAQAQGQSKPCATPKHWKFVREALYNYLAEARSILHTTPPWPQLKSLLSLILLILGHAHTRASVAAGFSDKYALIAVKACAYS
eukprot:124391-Pleurochrysis_carterae.AAC.1